MKRFKNILFVVNPLLMDGNALKQAVSLSENNQASLTVVSILEELPEGYAQKIHGVSMTELQDAIIDRCHLQLENQVSEIRQRIQVNTKVLTGAPFMALIREVLLYKRDLIIKTVEGKGIMDRLLCSTDMRLLRKCPCPVWLINPSKSKHHHKILAAVDFDPFGNKQTNDALNQQIIEMSISLALSEFFELHIIHVWHAYGESTLRSGFAQKSNADIDAYVEEIHAKHRRTLENFVAESISKAGKEVAAYLKPKIHLIKGLAIDVIPKMVKDNKIGVVMMGTVGRTGIPGFFMGNTAEMILCRIDCSVLAIKPEGFVTPVILEG